MTNPQESVDAVIAFEKVQGAYCSDILDQPRALRDTVAGFSPITDIGAIRDSLKTRRLRRVVLTGMGGSYQLLHPLHLRLISCGFDSIMAETSELLHSMPDLLQPENVIIAVSQSGASAEVVRLLEGQGPFYIGVTNTPASPLAQGSQLAVLTSAGEEGGVACKTAVASVAALYWLAQHLTGEDPGVARAVLETAAPAAEEYLSRWRDHVESLVGRLHGFKHVFFAGRGSSLAAVGLGAMLQKEAAHFHAEGMSSAALRHGPFEMLDANSFVVVFEGSDKVSEMNRALVRDVRATGASAHLCGFSVPDGPFALPGIDEALRPIMELLPTQMISLSLGYLLGREPGKFERITKVTTVE
ncbi:MAG TPA: SIS domain-containing protein [Bryobacteraceae bacterium]|nr:SIS domain-containing protein [Bryobacteraceae bacterium]